MIYIDSEGRTTKKDNNEDFRHYVRFRLDYDDESEARKIAMMLTGFPATMPVADMLAQYCEDHILARLRFYGPSDKHDAKKSTPTDDTVTITQPEIILDLSEEEVLPR